MVYVCSILLCSAWFTFVPFCFAARGLRLFHFALQRVVYVCSILLCSAWFTFVPFCFAARGLRLFHFALQHVVYVCSWLRASESYSVAHAFKEETQDKKAAGEDKL